MQALMLCRRGLDAKDAAECSREVAGVLAKFADAGGKGDTDRCIQAHVCHDMNTVTCSCLHTWVLHNNCPAS
jgi:hypothetical protein